MVKKLEAVQVADELLGPAVPQPRNVHDELRWDLFEWLLLFEEVDEWFGGVCEVVADGVNVCMFAHAFTLWCTRTHGSKPLRIPVKTGGKQSSLTKSWFFMPISTATRTRRSFFVKCRMHSMSSFTMLVAVFGGC